MKYVRYRSTGNAVGIEDGVEGYWEIGPDDHVRRSVHVLRDGIRLKYDEIHDADEFGALPEGVITQSMLLDTTVGMVAFITLADFETQWITKSENEN